MAGAPLGNKNRSGTRMFEEAVKRAILQDDGKRLRAIAEKLIDMAAEGDLQAMKELADRTDGKAKQAIVGGDPSDAPVQIAAKVEYVDSATREAS